jgi:GNAT superfamily N-acetyltransferase
LLRLYAMFAREVNDLRDEDALARLVAATRQYFLEKMPLDVFEAWVAEVEGQIVGAGWLVFYQRPPRHLNLSGLEANILDLYTLPEWRGKGVATAIMEAIIAFVKQTEARRIWLRATEAGRPLYRKLGFVALATEMELTW